MMIIDVILAECTIRQLFGNSPVSLWTQTNGVIYQELKGYQDKGAPNSSINILKAKTTHTPQFKTKYREQSHDH